MDPASIGLASDTTATRSSINSDADSEPPSALYTTQSPLTAAVGHATSASKLSRLRSAVLARRPVFQEIIRLHGHKSVRDYVREYVDRTTPVPHAARQAEFLNVFHAETEARLGKDVADSATNQLRQYYCASTMDHCGPLFHAWYLNFDLIAADIYRANPDPLLRNVITLSFSNVSLNNFSFPRGLAFNAEDMKGEMSSQRLAFFPSKMSTYPVFNLQAYLQDDIERMKSSLVDQEKKGAVQAKERSTVCEIIDSIFAAPEVLKCSTYAEQITKINYALWNRLYNQNGGKKVQLVYLEQESLVRRLLLEQHFPKKSLLSTLILDTNSVTTFMKYFDRLHDCFSIDAQKGTYLFWALPKGSKRRLSLWKDGEFLVSSDGTYRIALTAEAITQGLNDRELIPSTMLSLVMLSFYYGLHCFGGMGQVSYLPTMKEAYIRMMQDIGEHESAQVCATLPTKSLGGETTVAFLETDSGDLLPASAIDLILYGTKHTPEAIGELAAKTPLAESLDPTLPTEYPMLYNLEERETDLFQMNANEITKTLQQQKMLRACMDLHPHPMQDVSNIPSNSKLPYALPSLTPSLAYARALPPQLTL